jgi:hypothetical protein
MSLKRILRHMTVPSVILEDFLSLIDSDLK